MALPPFLEKALADPFPFPVAYGLRSGEIFVANRAFFPEGQDRNDPNAWIELWDIVRYEYPDRNVCKIEDQDVTQINNSKSSMEHERFNFARGINVKVSDIIWIADGPWGS